ncbi:MAG: hypothetical protein V2A73_02635 [Pseudomonadota bacterium]
MITLDDRGELAAKVNAPARMVLRVVPASTPASTVVELHRTAVGPRHLEDEGERIELGQDGAAEKTLEPGSYVLVLGAAGRHPLRYPLLLRRGEEEQVTLSLPLAETVPAGYRYVAAGWSLFGATDSEPVRQTYRAQPEHRISVGAFLIAEHEVTFGEYLEYLASLPAEEREKRKRAVSRHGFAFDVFR